MIFSYMSVNIDGSMTRIELPWGVLIGQYVYLGVNPGEEIKGIHMENGINIIF